jgi:hypothetical protein
MNPYLRVEKRVLNPARVRRLHDGFSWIDRRFVRDGLIDHLSREEILLYLFLVCVADANGLSYYGDRRVAATLHIPEPELDAVRARLVERGLLAYEAPLYQVLELPGSTPAPRVGGSARFGDLLREITARRTQRGR